MRHLWEIDHDYYCNRGNYYASESVCNEYRTFAEFMESMGDSDMDLNLLFRWDWSEHKDDEGNVVFNGDVNYRNGELLLFWMGQRKGLYHYSSVQVCRADEPAVIAFLKPRLAHLMKLWQPLSEASP